MGVDAKKFVPKGGAASKPKHFRRYFVVCFSAFVSKVEGGASFLFYYFSSIFALILIKANV